MLTTALVYFLYCVEEDLKRRKTLLAIDDATYLNPASRCHLLLQHDSSEKMLGHVVIRDLCLGITR